MTDSINWSAVVPTAQPAENASELGNRLMRLFERGDMTQFREEMVTYWDIHGDRGLDTLLAILAERVDASVDEPHFRGPSGVRVEKLCPLPSTLEAAYLSFLLDPASEGHPHLDHMDRRSRRSACIALAGRAVATAHCTAAATATPVEAIISIGRVDKLLAAYATEARSAAALVLATCLYRTSEPT